MTTPYETTSMIHIPGDTMSPQGGGQRKKLQLKPRSNPRGGSSSSGGSNRRRSSSAKGDPFGSAIPREQVLKLRGIDAATVDSRFEKKAAPVHYTAAQEMEIESVRSELSRMERKLREANEMELPEEEFRVAAEAKREELADLMKKYNLANEAIEHSRLERRASDHRRRTGRFHNEQQEQQDQHFSSSSSYRGRSGGGALGQDDDDNDAFVNFSSNRRRGGQHHHGHFEEQPV